MSDPTAAETAAGVAWYQVMALAALGSVAEAESLAERLRADAGRAGRFTGRRRARAGRDRAGGGAVARAARAPGRGDRGARAPAIATAASRTCWRWSCSSSATWANDDAALEWLDRCEREAERLGLGFVARDCQLQRAFLLARAGELSRARSSSWRARATQRGTGWRGVHRHEAEAQVAALRGDRAAAVTAASARAAARRARARSATACGRR